MSAGNDSEFDFAKYRRPELAENLSSIASIPGTLKTIAKSAALSLVTVWIVVPAVFGGRVHWGMLAAVIFYATLCAIAGGALVGVVLVLNKRLENLLQVVDVTLEISDDVSTDVSQLREGTKHIPTARQIVYGVYDSVVLPTLEGVVRGQSRLVGSGLFRIYRWSLGRVIARALRDAPHADQLPSSLADEDSRAVTLDTIDETATSTKRWIVELRDYLNTKGSTLQRIVVVPLVAIVGCAILSAAVPLVAIWWFAQR